MKTKGVGVGVGVFQSWPLRPIICSISVLQNYPCIKHPAHTLTPQDPTPAHTPQVGDLEYMTVSGTHLGCLHNGSITYT